ncbi:dicarboxylate/amino acid:cation symporter [Gemmatimonas groenlandica]|uniref:Cation:dicarboxylase symporter family transporter n=1 Tax=Gemmatimonas groenlandica TaxID=2732249 RepID=A0A6M4ISY2_9BACT|nr:cation:dicarboxylase symporter family transporter [Gemmatimonas groenlandica]QJR35361.1 cation:dicarboxylase symporter family transporter [Gemmatimonas groenlandica]
MKEGTRVLVALGLAVVFGALISASGSPLAIQVADALAPIGVLWVTAIRMTVIPLLVALIVTGVASASYVRDIGRMGASALIVFLALLIGAAAIVIPAAPLLFSLMPDGARPALPAGAAQAASEVANSGQTPTVASWLTSLLPSNPVSAAADGAMVPFILFVLLFAIAVARSAPESRATLVAFFRALGDAMMTLVRGVIWLAPIGVFAMVLPLAAHAGASMAGAIGFYIAAYALVTLLVIALLYPVVAIFGGIPMGRFAKAALPAQLIAFSSSSSLAALPALVEAAEDALALPKRVTGFMLPLGAAMFKLAAPTTWTAGAMFIAWFYNMPLHAPELFTIALASVFLGFASPGIPRGGFIMLTPLLLAVGLPVEGVGILIAVDAIPDTIATVLNVTGNLVATVLVARRTRA